MWARLTVGEVILVDSYGEMLTLVNAWRVIVVSQEKLQLEGVNRGACGAFREKI